MKYTISIIIASLFFLPLIPPAGAAGGNDPPLIVTETDEFDPAWEAEEGGEDSLYPYYSIGAKAWFSELYYRNHHEGSLVMYGGELNIDITDKFGVGASYLVGDDFLERAERDVNRSDLDVAFKYQLFSFLTGYFDFKRINYSYKIDVAGGRDTYEYEEKLNGIGFGLASAIPIFDSGAFIYLGGGYMPFIYFEKFDPIEDEIEKDIDYLYNLEGGVGFFYATEKVDFVLTVGYRLQDQKVVQHVGKVPENVPDNQPVKPFRTTHKYHLKQEGITLGLRVNW